MHIFTYFIKIFNQMYTTSNKASIFKHGRVRCIGRNLCNKVTKILILHVIFVAIIILITVIHHRPFILKNQVLKRTKKYKEPLPGTFVESYRTNNESYCNFMYNLPTQFSYEESDIKSTPELGSESSYRVLYNVIKNNYNSPVAPVTYATHLTPEFVHYIAEIVRYWEGPLSIAAFVPDFDADITTKSLINLCYCLPEMSKVSIHYVFPIKHAPFVQNHFKATIVPKTCVTFDLNNVLTYRNRKSLTYPVNVCRNVARNASSTDYVLVSDVELVPSKQLASRFIKAVCCLRNKRKLNFPSKVFVVPIFEVESYEVIPRTKEELMKLVRSEKAVYFHRHICSHCQRFPGLQQWFNQDTNEDVKLFAAARREFPYHRWEPIYIGTKNDPLYSEVLTWEGKQDKMTQILEMCLMGYKFIILDGAFLVHWPGIKRKSAQTKNRNRWRSPYLTRNSRQYNSIIKNLAKKYSKNPKCKVQ